MLYLEVTNVDKEEEITREEPIILVKEDRHDNEEEEEHEEEEQSLQQQPCNAFKLRMDETSHSWFFRFCLASAWSFLKELSMED